VLRRALRARGAVADERLGAAGEAWVERRLASAGWRLLARRLDTRYGELDLVFRDGAALVVVEVKTGRAGERFRPGQRLTRAVLERRWRAAEALARGGPHRVDLVEVALGEAGLELVHHRALRRPL